MEKNGVSLAFSAVVLTQASMMANAMGIGYRVERWGRDGGSIYGPSWDAQD